MQFFRKKRISYTALLVLIIFLVLTVAFSFYLPILLTHHKHVNGQFCNVCRNIERITQYYLDCQSCFSVNSFIFVYVILFLIYCVFYFDLLRTVISPVSLRVRMDN